MEPNQKKCFFLFSCVLREKVGKKKSLCIKHRDFLKKYKVVTLSDFTEGSGLFK